MTSSSEDPLLTPFFVYGMAAGFVGVFAFYYLGRDVVVPKVATKAFRERLAALPTKDQKYFYVTIPSMVHSLAHSFFHPAWISLGFSPEHNANLVTYFDESWPAFFQGVFAGYLIGDLIILGPKDLGPVYMVHHITASSIWIVSTHFRAMQGYASMLEFAEFSTIFLNIRQVILTAGYPSSDPKSLAASLAFFLSFFVVRIVPLPMIMYRWVTNDYKMLSEEQNKPLAVANSVSITVHVVLQSFWFSLMCKKFLGAVMGKKKGSNDKKQA